MVKQRIAGWKRAMWHRHMHPASGWTRVAVGVGLMVAIWFHDWPWLAVGLVAALTNPFWFPPAKDLDNFMSRAVLGELIWIRTARAFSQALVWGAGLAVTAPLVWALWTNRLGLSLALGALAVAGKGVFLWWTARLPSRRPDDGERALASIL